MILVLYDPAHALESLIASLSKVGVVSIVASSLAHVRELLEQEPAVAILSTVGSLEIPPLCQIAQAVSVPLYVVSGEQSGLRRVRAMQLGVHQYYIAPFSHLQVIHDLGATRYRHQQRVHYAGFSFDMSNMTAWFSGAQLTLSSQQFRALLTLARNVGQPVSRLQLSEAIWGGETPESANALDATIHRLRGRLPNEAGLRLQSIYGIGYRLAVESVYLS